GVAVIGIAVQRLGVEHELAAPGLGDRRRHRDLAAELVGRPGLALADALDLGGVQRVDLMAAPALSWARTVLASARSGPKRSVSTASPSTLRRMSRMTRPNRVRRNFKAPRIRLNWWAWL